MFCSILWWLQRKEDRHGRNTNLRELWRVLLWSTSGFNYRKRGRGLHRMYRNGWTCPFGWVKKVRQENKDSKAEIKKLMRQVGKMQDSNNSLKEQLQYQKGRVKKLEKEMKQMSIRKSWDDQSRLGFLSSLCIANVTLTGNNPPVSSLRKDGHFLVDVRTFGAVFYRNFSPHVLTSASPPLPPFLLLIPR